MLKGSYPTPCVENPETPLPLLDVPDAFQIEVPAGWQATAIPGREYTLTSGDDSELRIEFVLYPARKQKDMVAAVVTEAVRSWATSIGVEDPDDLTVLTPTGGTTPRGFASIPRGERNIYVGFFYFKKTFVVAAGTARANDRAGFARVEQLLWSIEAA
jgi:hypothetical protein